MTSRLWLPQSCHCRKTLQSDTVQSLAAVSGHGGKTLLRGGALWCDLSYLPVVVVVVLLAALAVRVGAAGGSQSMPTVTRMVSPLLNSCPGGESSAAALELACRRVRPYATVLVV